MEEEVQTSDTVAETPRIDESTDTTDERRVYELGYHMVSTLSDEELEKEVSSLRDAIGKHGGDFISEGAPVQMELAYPIVINSRGKNTKHEHSHFGWIKFEMDGARAAVLKTEVIAPNENILRHLLFKTVREDTRASERPVTLREVKSTDTLATPTKVEEGNDSSEEVSETELDKSIEEMMKD